MQSENIAPDLSGLPPAEDPAPVLRAWAAAWNARDVDSLLACFADDAVVRIIPPPPPPAAEVHRGRQEIRAWLNEGLRDAAPIQISNVRMLGNVVTWDTVSVNDGETIVGVSEAVVEGGKLRDLTP